MTSDAELIEQVKRGDLAAYGELVERYERAVLAAVLPVVGNAHAAEDTVQEVFTLAYRRLPSLRDGGLFGAWLLKIARREAVRASRSLRRLRMAPIDAAGDPAEACSEPAALDEDREHLLACVRRLPLHEQLTVSLRYFDGHSVQAIADMTGRPVGTITKRLSRAIERLRKTLT